jgi:hypothetical protein
MPPRQLQLGGTDSSSVGIGWDPSGSSTIRGRAVRVEGTAIVDQLSVLVVLLTRRRRALPWESHQYLQVR